MNGPDPARWRIRTGLLIPGGADPVPDACVDLDAGRIGYAGPASQAPPTAPGSSTVRVPVLMPGMWDCHTHLLGSQSGADILGTALTTRPALAGAYAAGDLARALDAGITSVRELGGYGVDLAAALASGDLRGPALYGAGAPLSRTGGHGDVHRMPESWVREHAEHGGVLELADGPDACLRAVRRQLRRGAAVVKVCASGGVLSDLDHPEHQQFSDPELRAIVEEADRADRVVAAHCHGRAGILAALRAGCRTIEHGTSLDPETADRMAEAGAVLVPTRTLVEGLLADAAALPPSVGGKLRAVSAEHAASVALARAAGVTIAAGTDLGLSTVGGPVSWGQNGAEPAHLVAAGLTPREAVDACTAHAPLTLGPQAPASGRVAAGYDADLIAPDGDPLRDITLLGDPARITHVWQRGVLVKGRPDTPAAGPALDLNPR